MTEVLFGFLLFLAVPAVAFYAVRKIMKGKKGVVNQVPENNYSEKIFLHNHDLSKWNYLGRASCRYVNERGNTTSEYPIFYFADKNNDRRSYFVSSAADKHGYVEKYVKPWAAGEYEFYELVRGETADPSRYLKQYMLDKFNCIWNNETNWWTTNDAAKYTAAKKKQKNEVNKKEAVTEDNVITLDFGKKA